MRIIGVGEGPDRHTMRAIVYTDYGPPDVLRLEERPKPVPQEKEILVRVRAAEATKSDCELRSFRFPVKWFWLPLRIAVGITRPRRHILGGYFSGEIEAVGAGVTKFAAGDEIFGATQLSLGAYGEYVCFPDHYTVVPKPSNITFEEAAAVPLGGLNAIHFMRLARIREGEQVLVNGAGGSIGNFGVQIAKAMGAEVTAVDSAIKENMLRRIGADHFVDYAIKDFTQTGQTYDVIFNMVAKGSYPQCLAALRPGGRYVTANPRASVLFWSVYASWFTDKKAVFALAGETEEDLLILKKMIEDGQIKPTVDRVYPMQQAADAHRRVETEQRLGSVVISLD